MYLHVRIQQARVSGRDSEPDRGGFFAQLAHSGYATATASSSFNVNRAEVLFAPELAVQADTSIVWATCFLSNREANPWFRLEFKTVTSIFNVRLSIREPPSNSGQASLSISLTDMDHLSVYVSNSSTLTKSNNELCCKPW